jgi:hypothetical protein
MLGLTAIRRYRGEARTHHARVTTVSASRLQPPAGAPRHHRGPRSSRVGTSVALTGRSATPRAVAAVIDLEEVLPHVDALASCPGPRRRAHRLHARGRIQPGCDRRAERRRPERRRSHAERLGGAVGVLTHRIVSDPTPGPVRGARRLHAVVMCAPSVVVRAPRGERESDVQPRRWGRMNPSRRVRGPHGDGGIE